MKRACEFKGSLRVCTVLISLLLEHGAMSQAGLTPLHGAAAFGHAAIIARLLADPRVDPRTRDNVSPGIC